MRTFLIAMLFPFTVFAQVTPYQIVSAVNLQRAVIGIAPLATSSKLEEIAQARASYLQATGDFSHSPHNGQDYMSLAGKEGYTFTYIGENLAVGYSDTATTMNAWMYSPDHRDNILSPYYSETGLAVSYGMFMGGMYTYVVEEFGSQISNKH